MGYDLSWGDGDEDGYFRVAIWRMPTLLACMWERGMLDETPLDDDAENDQFGCCVPSDDYQGRWEWSGEGGRYRIKTWDKIHAHKLRTNYHYVTATEVRGSLRALASYDGRLPDSAPPDDGLGPLLEALSPLGSPAVGPDERMMPEGYWHVWLKFLIEAAAHGGFAVD